MVHWLDGMPAKRVQRRRLAKGAHLFREGDVPRLLFRVEAGQIDLRRPLADGGTVVVGSARPGEAIAEASLFGAHYHCDAVASRDSEVGAYPIADIRAVLSSGALSQALAQDLARQVRDLRSLLEIRNIRSAEDRLYAWLNHVQDADQRIVIADSWAVVARRIGLTQESTYRAVGRLVVSRRIVREGRHVVRLPRRTKSLR